MENIYFLSESIDADNHFDHTEKLLDGALDTLSGQEHFGITDAQKYLYSALYANGIVPNRIDGIEVNILGNILYEFDKFGDMVTSSLGAVGNFFMGDGITDNLNKATKNIQNNLLGLRKLEGKQRLKSSHTSSLRSLFKRFITDLDNSVKKTAAVVVRIEKHETGKSVSRKFMVLMLKQGEFHQELLQWSEALRDIETVSDATRILNKLQSIVNNITQEAKGCRAGITDMEKNIRAFTMGVRLSEDKEKREEYKDGLQRCKNMLELFKYAKVDIDLKMKMIADCTAHLKPSCFDRV